MPNYCYNSLSILSDDEKVIKKILDYVKSEDNEFDFEKIIPMPDYIYRGPVGAEEEAIYGENNWHDWSCKNWGTKWNSEGATADGPDIFFETAWSPCLPVIDALAKEFPEAGFFFKYYEAGCAFCGSVEYHNGTRVFQMEGDYADPLVDDLDDSRPEIISEYEMMNGENYKEYIDSVEFVEGGITGQYHCREIVDDMFCVIDGWFVDVRESQDRIYW